MSINIFFELIIKATMILGRFQRFNTSIRQVLLRVADFFVNAIMGSTGEDGEWSKISRSPELLNNLGDLLMGTGRVIYFWNCGSRGDRRGSAW